MTDLEQEAREILEAFRKVCINKTPGPGYERTLADTIELVKRSYKQGWNDREADIFERLAALHPTDNQTREGE